MIKILEKGQKTFVRTCDRCGCKFQYDLSDLSGTDYISCPYCHTTIVHVGPKAVKIDLNKTNATDTNQINWDNIKTYTTPCKVEVGDGRYNYATTTGEYVNPNTVTTISVGDVDPKSGSMTFTGGDPNATIYANKLPDDIVDDKYNNIMAQLPDGMKDNCCYESDDYKSWYEKWCKEIRNKKPIRCKE